MKYYPKPQRSYKRVIGALLLLIMILIMVIFVEAKDNEPEQPKISFHDFIEPKPVEQPQSVETRTDIILTRYYPNDSTGSDKCTATKCTSEFEINDKGWYIYKGKVVMATATYACQDHCKDRAKYGPLPEGYRIYNFYDEIKFEIEGTTYTGIVMDSCGACMWNINGEKLQRYDIYTPNGTASSSLIKNRNVGKIKATLLTE